MPAKVESTGKIARIVLSGKLDFSTQEMLSDAMNQAVHIDGAKEVQVDMTDATFIDSSVIRSLLKLQEMASKNGKSLSIWNCNEQILETLVIGGFDQLFVIH